MFNIYENITMKKQFIIIGILLIFLSGCFYLSEKIKQNPTIPVKNTNDGVVIKPDTFFPMNNYTQRLNYREFGRNLSGSEKPNPCGNSFIGFHTGDDLETLSGEDSKEVPVFAIADGIIKQKTVVSGYGGLIVIEHNLDDQIYTSYYGHVDINKSIVNQDTAVRAGQNIAVLAFACSNESGGERKHLHFAIHKGDMIDVRGYVPVKGNLEEWINPIEFLKTKGAAEPKA